MKPKLKLSKNGKFSIDNVDQISYLYFPLTNFYSLKSSISPSLAGNANIDQNTFILLPHTNEDLHNSFMNRNVYFRVNGNFTWSITGNTAYQILHKDSVQLEADFLTHKITRTAKMMECTIESFVPFNDSYQELHRVILTNTSKDIIEVKPVISIPVFCRSADNIRDHRQVTSLLNKVEILKEGIINKPTFSFDERGHNLNNMSYGVFVRSSDGIQIKNYWPIMQEFIGEGRNLLNPEVVDKNLVSNYKIDDIVSGYESTGGFEYEQKTLKPNESIEFLISIMIDENKSFLLENKNNLSSIMFEQLKVQTLSKWKNELKSLEFYFGDNTLNGWLKWVTLQPILRRIYGNSFLPHHDYGRGGRGWRDLWQDCLALILMNPKNVRNLLRNNFSGVRIDGSNATIIGEKPGQFLADRNNIARVWMDHGSWPLITTMLYVDKMGDYEFLFEKQSYFYDKFTHYTKVVDDGFKTSDNILKDCNSSIYYGTVLEHLIIQNLVPYYNVGKHNNIRIEDADWNDALDMAHKDGESVAFTALYGSNLVSLGDTIKKLSVLGINSIALFKEIDPLLHEFDNSDISLKKNALKQYFRSVEKNISGSIKHYDSIVLADILVSKGNHLLSQVRENEWLKGKNGSWFNGYYDGDGNQLESVDKELITLTGQVFAVYSGAASNQQITEIIKSVDKYLLKPEIGGYILNTDFNEVKMNMGRLFGFAYGHKENGAMFSHMAVMYANALYKRGFVKAGHKVLNLIYKHCSDINKSKIYPGIPEYIDPNGRGMYTYLTGSASWFILTEVTEVFGIKADIGKLILEPKLLLEEFDQNNEARIDTLINGKMVSVTYSNKKQLEYGRYKILEITTVKRNILFEETSYGVKIDNDFEENSLMIRLG